MKTTAVAVIMGAWSGLLGGSSATNTATTLRGAADGLGIYVGSAMNHIHLAADSDYSALGAKEYSLITEENACKMT